MEETKFAVKVWGVCDPRRWCGFFREKKAAVRFVSVSERSRGGKGKVKLESHAMKRVAAGAHLPTPCLFEPAKCPGDRADYRLDCSFLPQCKHQVLVFTSK